MELKEVRALRKHLDATRRALSRNLRIDYDQVLVLAVGDLIQKYLHLVSIRASEQEEFKAVLCYYLTPEEFIKYTWNPELIYQDGDEESL